MKVLKNYLASLLLLSGGMIFSGCSQAPLPLRPEAIQQPKVHFTPPEIQEWIEPNGLTVLLLPDPALPLIEGNIYFPYGSLHETPDLVNTTGVLFSQLRSGGIRGKTPLELDRALDSIGASIEASSGSEFSSVSFFSHKDDFKTVFDLFSKVIREPAFNESRLMLWKRQVLDSLIRRREDPETIASMTFTKAMYTGVTPYNTFPTKEFVQSVSKESLIKLAQAALVPEGTILTVSGQITREELSSAIKSAFGGWGGSRTLNRIISPPIQRKSPGIYVVESPFDQATIVVGEPGPARLSPDQYGLSVFNRYFSHGDFGSVLFSEIRSKRGFAYVVYGGFAPGAKSGQYLIGMGTRVPEAGNAIDELLNQVNLAKVHTASEKRLSEIKRAVQQGFVFNFASPDGAIAREATLRLLGYPKDYNKTYVDRINEVSREDLLTIAKSRISSEDFVIVVVGKISAKELSQRFGSRYPVYQVKFDTEPRLAENTR